MQFPRPEAEAAARAHSVAPTPTRAADIDMHTRSLALLALCVAGLAEPLSEGMDALGPLDDHLPLQRDLKSRSDAFNPYANEFTQEYEPVAFAAIPLGSPMPIIAVLTDNPLIQPKHGQQAIATSLKQIYSKPDYQNYVPTDYAKPNEGEYQKPYEYQKYPNPPTEYLKQYPSLEYPKHYSSIEFGKAYPPVEYKYPTPEYTKPYPEYSKPYVPEYRPYRVEYAKPYTEEYVKPYASVEAPTILYARPSENGGYTYSRRPLKKRRNVKRPQKQKPMIIRVHKYRVVRSRRSGHAGSP